MSSEIFNLIQTARAERPFSTRLFGPNNVLPSGTPWEELTLDEKFEVRRIGLKIKSEIIPYLDSDGAEFVDQRGLRILGNMAYLGFFSKVDSESINAQEQTRYRKWTGKQKLPIGRPVAVEFRSYGNMPAINSNVFDVRIPSVSGTRGFLRVDHSNPYIVTPVFGGRGSIHHMVERANLEDVRQFQEVVTVITNGDEHALHGEN